MTGQRSVHLTGIFVLLLCWGGLVSQAAAGGPGTTSANFLKAGQGVRPVAMGETYIALGDGLDTLYWNPAGLVQVTAPTASFSHSFWFQDIGTEYLAYGMSLGPLGAIGGGFALMHAGQVTETLEDEYGNYLGTGDTFSPMSFALIGTYAQNMSRLFQVDDPFIKNTLVGASLRVITESLDEVVVFGGALDLGLIWRETEEVIPPRLASAEGASQEPEGEPLVRDHGWRLGLVAQNLGVTTEQLMPMNFRLGLAYLSRDLFTPGGAGTLACDLMVPIDNDIKVSFGGEYAYATPNTKMAIRMGYKIGSEIKDLDSLAGLTAGVGFSIRTGLMKYQVDYAFVPYGELGLTHRASLTVVFLPGPSEITRKPQVLQPGVRPPIFYETWGGSEPPPEPAQPQ